MWPFWPSGDGGEAKAEPAPAPAQDDGQKAKAEDWPRRREHAAPEKPAAAPAAEPAPEKPATDDLTSLIVRTSLHHILVGVAVATALSSRRFDICAQLLAAALVLEGGFLLLQTPVPQLRKLGLDPTVVRYLTSLLCWAACLHIVICWGLCIGLSTTRPSENVLLAATVAIGAGAQSLLANFSAGLLLILQRPYRVGDMVTVGEDTFEVTSIMSFVTHGKTRSAHVTVPNARVLNAPIFNLSSRRVRELVVAVHVRQGQHPCAAIRKALHQAVAHYNSGRDDVLERAGAGEEARAELMPAACYGPLELGARGMRWELRCEVPAGEEARLRCTGLAYECVHDELMAAGIALYETSEVLM